jgi:nicotinamide phosphoribosyltransferase
MMDFNSLYWTDGYKLGHKDMLAPGTSRLYRTKIPRKVKYMPKGINKIVSFGEQMAMRWLHDQFQRNFFGKPWTESEKFGRDISKYLGQPYSVEHFKELWNLGYLPIRVKALPEGLETPEGVPHSTSINTIDGFGWLTLYLETIDSADSWKQSTSATLALAYRRNATEWVMKTDPSQAFLIPYLCHDFSARGLSPWDMVASGLGHATCFRGSDTLAVIPAARAFYDEDDDEVCINSVNASEHSVTCTGIFYYNRLLRAGKLNHEIDWYYSFDLPCDGSVENPDYLAIAECLNLRAWLDKFPTGILSSVDDTMNYWKKLTHIYPRLKDKIMARDGKLVSRPDSGNPVEIVCGLRAVAATNEGLHYREGATENEIKGAIEILWDIFGGHVNEQGYKVLDPHIGCIYGDSINLDKQVAIYSELARKEFAATNIVLGVGSFTYQFNSRDSLGWAVKASWFETVEWDEFDQEEIFTYNIYKDPITDSGTKKSLKGFIRVNEDFSVQQECTPEEEEGGLLLVIYENGIFYNQTTLTKIRERIDKLV